MELNAIILSGGRSSRMSCDKALIEFQGQSILERIVSLTNEFVSDCYIVSDNNSHDVKGASRLPDRYKEVGPLGGLYTGLKASDKSFNLVLSCDLMFLDENILATIIKKGSQSKARIICVSVAGRIQPLCGIYHKEVLPRILHQLNSFDLKLNNLIANCDAEIIELTKEEGAIVSNINSPSDLVTFDLMKIKVLCFGRVAEILSASSIDLVTNSKSLEELKTELELNYPELSGVSFQMAINEVVEQSNTLINMNDTIALLPPFAGG